MIRQSALAFLLIVAAATTQAAEKSLDKAFTVAPGGELVVDADGANIRVSGDNSNRVAVKIRARASDEELSRLTFDAVQSGSIVTVTLKDNRKKGGWFNWGSSNREADIEVTVPASFRINTHTSGGNVNLTDIKADALLRTSGGDIAARNIVGKLEARTSGGAISVDTLRGDVDANTSGGDVKLLRIDGKIRGRTSGGSIQCSLEGPNRGITATTSGGDIELRLPANTTGEIDASTGGGDVTSDLPVTATRTTETSLSGSLNGGGERIEARTSGGSIRLRAN